MGVRSTTRISVKTNNEAGASFCIYKRCFQERMLLETFYPYVFKISSVFEEKWHSFT